MLQLSQLVDFTETSPGKQLGMVWLSDVPVTLTNGDVEIHAKLEVLQGHERNGRLHAHGSPEEVLEDREGVAVLHQAT